MNSRFQHAKRAILDIKNDYQMVIMWLMYIDGFSGRQVASKLKMKESTVSYHKRRAIKHLKENVQWER